MTYRIELSKNSEKVLKKLQPKLRGRVLLNLERLAHEPLRMSENLSGQLRGRRKTRLGDIRIIFYIDDDNREVQVVDIEHRGSAY